MVKLPFKGASVTLVSVSKIVIVGGFAVINSIVRLLGIADVFLSHLHGQNRLVSKPVVFMYS